MYKIEIKLLKTGEQLNTEKFTIDDFQFIIVRPPNEKRILDTKFNREFIDKTNIASESKDPKIKIQKNQEVYRDYFHLGRVLLE